MTVTQTGTVTGDVSQDQLETNFPDALSTENTGKRQVAQGHCVHWPVHRCGSVLFFSLI